MVVDVRVVPATICGVLEMLGDTEKHWFWQLD